MSRPASSALASAVKANPLDVALHRRYAAALDAEARKLTKAPRARKQIEADCQRELADLLPVGEVIAGKLLAVRLDLPLRKGGTLAAVKVYGLLRGKIARFVYFLDLPEVSGERRREVWLDGLRWWASLQGQEAAGGRTDEVALLWDAAS